MRAQKEDSPMQNFREEKIELFRRVCKERNIKVTPQRLEIFLVVVDAEDHPSAEDVLKRVRKKLPTVSLDTVYRTLSTFEQLGLIAKVSFLEGKTRFDPNTKHHHHLVCTKCKKVKDFAWHEIDEIKLPPEAEGWGEVKRKVVEVRGICSECLTSAKVEHRAKGSGLVS